MPSSNYHKHHHCSQKVSQSLIADATTQGMNLAQETTKLAALFCLGLLI